MRLMPTVAALALVLAAACGGSGGAKPQASLKLTNDTPAGAIAPSSSLGVKIVAVYLAEDYDPYARETLGRSSLIWLNPECGGDVAGCDVAGAAASPRAVTSFLELARPSVEVNADLRAGVHDVEAGTYRYARVEFCRVGPPDAYPNVKWQGPGMSAPELFTGGECSRSSQALAVPLTVADGAAVEIDLAYDLSRVLVSGTPSAELPGMTALEEYRNADGSPHLFRSCVDLDAASRTCVDFLDFTASARAR